MGTKSSDAKRSEERDARTDRNERIDRALKVLRGAGAASLNRSAERYESLRDAWDAKPRTATNHR
jgi:hypothetical protein